MSRKIETEVGVTASAKGINEAAAAVDKLLAQMLDLNKGQKDTATSSIKLTKAIRGLDNATDPAAEELMVLNKDLDRLGANMQKVAQETKEYATAVKAMDGATDDQIRDADRLAEITQEQADIQSRLNREVHESTQKSEAATAATKQHAVAEERLTLSLEEGYVAQKASTDANQQHETELKRMTIAQDANYLAVKSTADANLRYKTSMKEMALQSQKQYVAQKSLVQVNQQMTNEQRRLKIGSSEVVVALRAQEAETHRLARAEIRAKTETRLFGIETQKLKESLVTAVAAGGVAGIVFKGLQIIGDGFRRAGEAAKEFQRQATETFSSVEEEVARSKAQIPELVQSQEELYSATVRAAREIGRGPLETQTALRKAMNLGLDYNDAMQAVEVSTKAARVANADMTETLITGMSTVNAYGRGMYDINAVLDQYAYLVQNSNLETQDLISGMAKIISPAAEAGVSLEEVTAAMVVMNRQGDDFQEIGDLLGNMLTQLAVRGTTAGRAFEAAAGMGFREFTAAGGTLIEGLILLEDHADDTEQSISELVQGNSKFYRDMLAGRGVLELTGRHTAELAEAYEGALLAQGTLADQTAQFTGTLYLATEEMNAAKEAAWATEGSLTQGLARGFTNAKTTLYDLINTLSTAAVSYKDLNSAFNEATTIYGGDFVEIENFIVSIIDKSGTDLEIQHEINKTRAATAEIIRENVDISKEELEIAIQNYYWQQLALEGAKQEKNIYQDMADIDRIKEFDRMTEAQREAYELQKAQADEAERIEKAEAAALLTAEQKAKWEQIIAERLAEQYAILVSAYDASKSYIDNISGLQVDLGLATDPEEIEQLKEQLKEAGESIDTYYRQALIDSIVANGDFSESTIDLKVKLGLLTKEAGELQKEFLGIKTEIDLLGQSEGFNDLNLEQQALAAERVAAGLMTAKEAVEQFDPSNWREGVAPGIVRSEEGFRDAIVNVRIPEADEAKLTAMEEQLTLITTSKWETWVYANIDPAEIELDALELHLSNVVYDRHMTIYVDYQTSGGPNPDKLPPEFATGGSMIVPPGYNNDDFLIGVSSGEYVNVTTAGQSPGGGGGINIEVINQFATGVHNPGEVASASQDGLYSALEKAGLI